MFRTIRAAPVWRTGLRTIYIASKARPAFHVSRQLTPTTFYRFNTTTNNEEIKQKLSSEQPAPKVYSYQDIKNLITHPDPNKILVDVREPAEYQEYAIPTAINIPYKSTPGALDLSPEEFEDVFKFEKPSKDKELIFYCVAGIRSTAAADLAQIFGYEKLGNYKGSMEDWLQHEKKDEPKN